MGLCYAIIHGPTQEAYDLGKCPGDPSWREGIPQSREEVLAYFEHYFEGSIFPDAPGPVTDAVWAFASARPGCRLVDENDEEVVWYDDPDVPPGRLERLVRDWGAGNIYRIVGSRYDDQEKRPL